MESQDEIAEFDDAVVSLFRLAREHKEEAQAAGRRTWQRAEEWIKKTQAHERASIQHRRELIDRVRDAVLQGQDLTDDHDPAAAQQFLDVLREYEKEKGDLARRSSVEAYADAVARRHRQFQKDHGRDLTPIKELRREVKADFDVDSSDNACARTPFALAEELRAALDDAELEPRTRARWWELAVLVLVVQWPDAPTLALGVDATLPLGGWNEPGGDIFNHRDGMLEYLFRTAASDTGHRAREEAEYRCLVIRTEKYLRAHCQGDEVGADEQGADLRLPEDGAARDTEAGLERYRFVKLGKTWQVTFEGESGSFPDRAGFGRIHLLLTKQGEEVRIEDLVGVETLSRGDLAADIHARQELVARKEELLECVASSCAPAERAVAQEELERVEAHLKGVVGFGKKPRRTGDERKAAANSVGISLRRALEELEPDLPDFAQHLRNAIVGMTSMSPAYRPTSQVNWLLHKK